MSSPASGISLNMYCSWYSIKNCKASDITRDSHLVHAKLKLV